MKLPARTQLLLPLLETLEELGGSAKAAKAIEVLSDRLGIPEEVRTHQVAYTWEAWGTRQRYPWRQHLHWVRQDGASKGLIGKNGYGTWSITEQGSEILHNAKSGLILVVYETPCGQAVWAEAQTAAGSLKDGEVNLIFSSPPYPILNGRGYGTFNEAEIVKLIVSCAREWKRALCEQGSLVLNFKDVWLPKAQTGGAVRSLYQEKLLLALCEDVGFYFADRHYWRNPSHSPESNWVTVQKVRCNNDMENIFWLAKNPNPHADSREVMVEAKASTIATYKLRAARGMTGSGTGPSKQRTNFEEQMTAVASGTTLKVIPRNYHEISNANTHIKLREALQLASLPRHDAMMPLDLAKFFIKFLTRPGQTVHDSFFGSGTTGVAAEELGRRWIGSDRSLAHLLGSALRFNNPNFEPA
jgi:DNA modification methylase